MAQKKFAGMNALRRMYTRLLDLIDSGDEFVRAAAHAESLQQLVYTANENFGTVLVYRGDQTSTLVNQERFQIDPADAERAGLMTVAQFNTLTSLDTWRKSMPALAPAMTTGFAGNVTTLQSSSGVSVVSTNGDKVTGLPADAPSRYGLLLCCGFGATNQLQVFFTFSHPCYIYSRQKLGGTWRDWCRLVPGTSSASAMSLMDDMGAATADGEVADDTRQEGGGA